VLVVGITGGVLALSGGSTPAKHRAAPPPSTTTTTEPVAAASTIATVAGEQLDVFAEPAETSEKLATLQKTTSYRVPTTLLVDPRRGATPDGVWLPVTVPIEKPNSTPGWIRATDVTLAQSPYKIVVFRGRHVIELLKGDEVVLESKIIIGAPWSQTPTGTFYVTDPINCNKESVPGYPVAHCGGVYGAFAIGTSGLSEMLDSFSGTIPQIALHGTNLPATELGKDLSNGCIRMPDDVILQIASITPLLGTPVTISPY
jgi:lipoprotein-anchoring transpeptidase ErfK/SrfK